MRRRVGASRAVEKRQLPTRHPVERSDEGGVDELTSLGARLSPRLGARLGPRPRLRLRHRLLEPLLCLGRVVPIAGLRYRRLGPRLGRRLGPRPRLCLRHRLLKPLLCLGWVVPVAGLRCRRRLGARPRLCLRHRPLQHRRRLGLGLGARHARRLCHRLLHAALLFYLGALQVLLSAREPIRLLLLRR